MKRKIYTIFNISSYLLIILGVILLIPIGVARLYGEEINIHYSFIIPSILSLLTGVILKISMKSKNLKLDITTSMIAVAIAWVVSSIIGALPLMLGLNVGFIDALFESVSGFTTTGITVLQGLEYMPKSLIFWRCLMQWLGGLGILTFFLLISTRFGVNLWQLFSAESHKINTSRPVPNIYKTIKILWSIYILFTFLEIILLVIFKMPLFEAVIHSFTSLSTGGFSNYDSSIGHYAQSGHPYFRQIEYIITFFMLLGGINFLIHYKVLTGDFKAPFKNVEVKEFMKIIFLFTFIILLGKSVVETDIFMNFESKFRKVLFQVVSIITTTGFGTEYIGSPFFPVIGKQLFLVLMLIGGCVGSTAGGIKVLRVVILKRLFKREVKKIYYPDHAVLPVTLERNIIDAQEIYRITALFFAWLFLIFVGAGITTLFSDLNAIQSLSGMFSAVGNIGPFYFSVEKMASLSPVIKITYIIGMLAGRLEILPLFILFSKKSWKS
ncbi:MAG: TrkH family potassium uptake protein [Bacillota bacterium]